MMKAASSGKGFSDPVVPLWLAELVSELHLF